MRLGRQVTGVLVGAALVLAAACGGGTGDVVTVEVSAGALAAASERTAAVATGHFEMSVGSGNEYEMEIVGVFDNTRRRVAGTLSSTSSDPKAISMSGLEMRAEGDMQYVRGLPGYEQVWIRLQSGPVEPTTTTAAESPSVRAEVGMYRVGPENPLDPGAYLEHLRSASDDIRDLGPSTSRGVPTRRLAGTLRDPTEAQNVTSTLPVSFTRDITFVADIDAAGLVRRVELTMVMGVAGELATGLGADQPMPSLRPVVEFFDFDAPVDIEVPPAGEILDETDLPAGIWDDE